MLYTVFEVESGLAYATLIFDVAFALISDSELTRGLNNTAPNSLAAESRMVVVNDLITTAERLDSRFNEIL